MQPTSPPLIAVDLDDVLCQTNEAAAKWHNNKYGTSMTLSDFHFYHWWKNPGWGNPEETAEKVEQFYQSREFENVEPVIRAVEGVKKLKSMGYKLSVLTSRDGELRTKTLKWLEKWFPIGIFDQVYFSEDLAKSMNADDNRTSWTWPTKAYLCGKLNANLLIDDSVENAIACVDLSAAKRTPVLLFGDYDWGQRKSTSNAPDDRLSFEERQIQQKINGWRLDWWEDDFVDLPPGIWRVNSWEGVISWSQREGKDVLETGQL